MSESNGTYSNAQLYAAAIALIELGRATKPQVDQSGQRIGPPQIAPLPGSIGMRLAFCRNALRPLAEAYEEALAGKAEAHPVPDPPAEDATPEVRRAWVAVRAAALAAAQREQRDLAKESRNWEAPDHVQSVLLMDRAIPDEWLAAWMAVGIVVGELPPEDNPDKKAKL